MFFRTILLHGARSGDNVTRNGQTDTPRKVCAEYCILMRCRPRFFAETLLFTIYNIYVYVENVFCDVLIFFSNRLFSFASLHPRANLSGLTLWEVVTTQTPHTLHFVFTRLCNWFLHRKTHVQYSDANFIRLPGLSLYVGPTDDVQVWSRFFFVRMLLNISNACHRPVFLCCNKLFSSNHPGSASFIIYFFWI